MKEVISLGRYRVHKHRRRWIVVKMHGHGEGCISTHASRSTALAALRRYYEGDEYRKREAAALLVGLLDKTG